MSSGRRINDHEDNMEDVTDQSSQGVESFVLSVTQNSLESSFTIVPSES